jgi:prepilin-type N-terminal cleavage/methylation domain-containing protein
MKKKGFTLIELLVVIAIIAMLLAILMPALNKVKKIAMRVICGTNLKGLGTAQNVYANDYDDEYVVQGAKLPHTWVPGTKTTPSTVGTPFQNLAWLSGNTGTPIGIGASLYLLVREADVSPKSFVCPAGGETEFSGKNANNLDITQLFDFGYPVASGTLPAEGPARCVSYSYQMPYAAGQTNPAPVSTGSRGKYFATGGRSASFAVMADKNPYFDPKLTTGGGPTVDSWVDKVSWIGVNVAPPDGDWTKFDKWRIQVANAQPHDRDGQNVTYADGHNSYETRTDVGTKNDCIYTPWSGTGATETDRRRGTFVATPATQSAPQGTEDSMLVNDI